jgi:multidrug efflux pump subunit AcrB
MLARIAARPGSPVRSCSLQLAPQAVVDAGAVRFRPMALTAEAVIVGSTVILFDPIFQGLAISLMGGEVASLLLSRMTVPITYYLTHRRRTPAVAVDPVAAA